MKIAVSGTHFSGKSTFIEALHKKIPEYTLVDEPYYLLEQLGHPFSNPPTLEDYKQQFELSNNFILESDSDSLFDRCPIDFLAYALALGKDIDHEKWIPKLHQSIPQLDLIFYIPIETPDRISLPPSENQTLREDVDLHLQDFLLHDSLNLLKKTKVIQITGTLDQRVTQALKTISPS